MVDNSDLLGENRVRAYLEVCPTAKIRLWITEGIDGIGLILGNKGFGPGCWREETSVYAVACSQILCCWQ